MGKEWLGKVKSACPEVRWVAHYALLGQYDFMDIYEAPDNETVARASVEIGSRGSVSMVTMPAIMLWVDPARDDGLAAGAGRPPSAHVWTGLAIAIVLAVGLLTWTGLVAFIVAAIGAVETELYQTRNQRPKDKIAFPIQLNDRLAGLLWNIQRADSRPNRAHYSVYEELSTELDALLVELDTILAEADVSGR